MHLETTLKDLRVLQEGHFLLNSGLHSRFYFEKFRILENPEVTTMMCGVIAAHYGDSKVDWIIGPTTGGIIIAFEVARQMKKKAGFAEEREGQRVVGRGFDIRNKDVLIVDDVLTTGKSLIETVAAVKGKGGRVTGVAVLIDRSNIELPFEYFATYRKVVENYQPENCPLCKSNVPLSQLGGA